MPPTLARRLLDVTLGSEAETCSPPTEPVRFGQRHWLAQHRWLEPMVGLVALLPVGVLYALSIVVLTRVAAVTLLGLWVVFLVAGLVLRVVRPCTVLRLPIHALVLWLLVVLTAGPLGLLR